MKPYLIEPRDPLIARDGRPFGPVPGARASSLPFPMPSTIAGGLRTRAGSNERGVFDRSRIEEVKQLELRGPLLVRLDEAGLPECFAPVPADALMLEERRLLRLVPLGLEADDLTDLPADLAPVGLPSPEKGKPRGMPAFWRWEHFKDWLLAPTDRDILPGELGSSGPGRETRTHVSLDPATGTAREGALFQTAGLEFTALKRTIEGRDHGTLARAEPLALLLETSAELAAGLAPLGGERRLVRWRSSPSSLPGLADGLAREIAAAGACRVLLLTPACFAQGHRPGWLLEARGGVTPTLRAAAVGRPQVVSGWDMASGQAKPTRRLAPAGSVYFLTLSGTPEAIEAWVGQTWMHNVSDDSQDRRDGFGLAALGVWSGQPVPLTAEEAQP